MFGLVALIVVVGLRSTRNPLEGIVIGKTNDAFGRGYVLLMLSNRTQRTCAG
jgi:hypothetical protein